MPVFVGRAHELAELDAAAAAARSGRPRVVLVEGEAGIGKSSLLTQFSAGLQNASVLRASGDDAELRLPYGIVAQIVGGARGAGAQVSALLASGPATDVDPLAVGAELVALLGELQVPGEHLALAIIDDLQWADGASARALLFAVRRLQADRVLVLLSARGEGLSRLGEGWQRFLAGDPRAGVLGLAGLDQDDVIALSRGLGLGDLSRGSADRLVSDTGGNPLYCRAVLEELGPAAFDRSARVLTAPRAVANLWLARLFSLTDAAQALAISAAVLGPQSELHRAAAMAELSDPMPALEEAVKAGILAEKGSGGARQIVFTHHLVQGAIYSGLSPARRRLLHERAAGLVGGEEELHHRIAAAVGPDDKLAGELELAAREAAGRGRIVQAADWLAHASATSSHPGPRARRLLDSLEMLIAYGEVAEAQRLVARATDLPSSAHRSGVLGALALYAGRTEEAESYLLHAWEQHDGIEEASVGATAALSLAPLCLNTGRPSEAVEWGERAIRAETISAALRHQALGTLALALCFDGRSSDGLARLDFLPAAPARVPREDSDALVMRGMVRALVEDLPGATADLSAGATRLRSGVPLHYASQCLSTLADAEYRSGAWDDAVVHGELAVSLAHDADRVWDFPFVHTYAALVPAARGDWEVAGAHVRLAVEGAQGSGDPEPIAAAVTAQASLAMAQADLEGVIAAAASVRTTGRAEIVGRPGHYDWRTLEIAGLIGLARFDQAEAALAELQAVLSRGAPISAVVAAARLRGALATAGGDLTAATEAFEAAWRHAQKLRVPLEFALLEISDARRLRAAGRRDLGVSRLRSARARLVKLRALPYLKICERELVACAVHMQPEVAPGLLGLSRSELVVARLVAQGRTNREVASELYVSVKTVEFHLGHIFGKLGIRSRHELTGLIGGSEKSHEPG